MQRKLTMLSIASALALLTIGCTAQNSGDFCLHAQQIDHLDSTESLNDQHARALQKMDEYGMQKCGWK